MCALHSRYADLKQVVLDELLAQHGDAQLDAQLHEAACVGALQGKDVNICQRVKSNMRQSTAEGGREF